MATMGESGRIETLFDGNSASGVGPAELLRRFVGDRDEAAFEAIVAHHGPMVLATCRRLLGNKPDADDAFQATFLVFARQARSIADPDRLAPWLHSVARRVSARSRSTAARRQAFEGRGGLAGTAAAPAPDDDLGELRSVLDEELARLPEKYRAPLVLCYLEGLTHDQAAGRLAWPVGTVRSRLAGGRDRLRWRLARRGYAAGASAVLSPATLPSAAVPPPLRAATLRLALATAPQAGALPAAALLAQGTLTAMLIAKVQAVAACAAVALSVGAVVVARPAPPAGPPAAPKGPAASPPPVAGPLDEAGRRLARERLDGARKDATIAQLQVKLLELQLKLIEEGGAEDRAAGSARPRPAPEGPGGAGGGVIALPASAKVLICPPEGNRATIVETFDGARKAYRDPGTVARFVPVIAHDLVGLQAEGPRITQVVAYCRAWDEWYACDLREPVDGKVVPIIRPHLVHYRVGRHVYAFSDLGRRWGVLELKQPAPPGPIAANGECLIIAEGDTTHVFNYQSGDWSHLSDADYR